MGGRVAEVLIKGVLAAERPIAGLVPRYINDLFEQICESPEVYYLVQSYPTL